MQRGTCQGPPRVIVPRPDRVRANDQRGFGWVDARLHRDGWLAVMPPEAVSVYMFLCLVANHQGISWYRRDRIRHGLLLSESAASSALQRLVELDLVAYRPFGLHASEGFRQVLSIPEGGPSPVLGSVVWL